MVPFPEEESANKPLDPNMQQNQQDNQNHGVPLHQIKCDKLPSSKLLLIKQGLLFGLSDINCRLVFEEGDKSITAVYQQMLTL